ncbi:hypothetical protein OEZ86_009138 [Tetradesmus obliquus]|nr:hypothetical protein OEZ86_009138 [Tetradesmus obliquus]
MQTHRQLARDFTEQQKQQAAAEAQQQAELNLQEEQRRRQNQVSKIDFRYSRLHEMGVPQLVTNHKELQENKALDAATQAQSEAARSEEDQARRQQQLQENARKAADRGVSAQMLLQAERNRQRMEQALQEMESNEIQQRQQDLAAGRTNAAPLLRKWQQQRRKAQARKAFEQDFLPGPAAEARMQQGLPSFLTAEPPPKQDAAAAAQADEEECSPAVQAAAADRALKLVAELERQRKAEAAAASLEAREQQRQQLQWQRRQQQQQQQAAAATRTSSAASSEIDVPVQVEDLITYIPPASQGGTSVSSFD